LSHGRAIAILMMANCFAKIRMKIDDVGNKLLDNSLHFQVGDAELRQLKAKILIARREDCTHGASKWKPASSAFWANGRTTAQNQAPNSRLKVNKTLTKNKKTYTSSVIYRMRNLIRLRKPKNTIVYLRLVRDRTHLPL
jgi:hypothetical protein